MYFFKSLLSFTLKLQTKECRIYKSGIITCKRKLFSDLNMVENFNTNFSFSDKMFIRQGKRLKQSIQKKTIIFYKR